MLGHLSIGVTDLERAGRFYDAAMSALGYARVFTGEQSIGYGVRDTTADKLLLNRRHDARPPGGGTHIAFNAPSRDAVNAFHTAALNAGGTDSGAPGLRAHYGPTYYAAFVIDPDGYRIEAVHQ